MNSTVILALMFVLCFSQICSGDVAQDIARILLPCKKTFSNFDNCIKNALNEMRPYFKTGIPSLGVAPFDPHFAAKVKERRGANNLTYAITLTNVYEHGWTNSMVTKFKTHWKHKKIIFSQYFPEKWLNGEYTFKGRFLHYDVLRSGFWNITLRNYTQTTMVERVGHNLDVQVEINHIEDMEIHVGNLLRGSSFLENMLDRVINASWKPGFLLTRALINDLVSTAFTDIWNKSFKDFPLEAFIRE